LLLTGDGLKDRARGLTLTGDLVEAPPLILIFRARIQVSSQADGVSESGQSPRVVRG
jgi:hypothetical protein